MHPILALILGLVFAGIGGELFVRGAVGIAQWARVPAGIIGATIAAFATSSPELSVAVNAAAQGTPAIAFGDALGSNVVNVGLILGLALLWGPVKGAEAGLRRDLPVTILAPVLTAGLAFDGTVDRLDATILLLCFVGWLVTVVHQARRSRDATSEVLGEQKHGRALLEALAGLALLVLSGDLIVQGAKFVGGNLGWDPFVVGATLVALGTSMPELATTIISRLRGHDEVGLGTVLGSNIFNGLFIVAVAGLIRPIEVPFAEVQIGLGAGLLMVLAIIPHRGEIARARAALLLGLYVAYVAALVLR